MSGRARSLFWRGLFAEADLAAKEEEPPDALTLALVANSRRERGKALRHLLDENCADRRLNAAAARIAWSTAMGSGDVRLLERVAVRLPPGSRSGQRARRLLDVMTEYKGEMVVCIGERATCNLVDGHPLPVIEVRISGRECYFLVDTGADFTYISPEIVELMGIRAYRFGEGLYAGGNKAAVSLVVLPHLEIGELCARNVPALVPPCLAQIGDRRLIHGIIGMQILSRFAVTWDFSKCLLQLDCRDDDDSAYYLEARTLASNIVVMKCCVDGVFGWYMFDSGGTLGVALDGRNWRRVVRGCPVEKEHGHDAVGGELDYELRRGGIFGIGGHAVHNIDIVGGVFPEAIKKRVMTNVSGLFSHHVLRRFKQIRVRRNWCQIRFVA